MNKDHVDIVLAQWRKERPDINPSPMGISGRLIRAQNFFSGEMQKVFSRFGLNPGEFDVLATLLRSGQPYTLTPNQLLKALMLSSGAMTNRIDRLEVKELVERLADPNDRRGVRVALTTKGYKLISEVITHHVEKCRQMASPLTDTEQETLALLLKKLLNQFE